MVIDHTSRVCCVEARIAIGEDLGLVGALVPLGGAEGGS